MSTKKYKVNKGKSKEKQNSNKIDVDKLYAFYQKKITSYPFNELVLIVLGGEFGIIAKFMKENIPFSKLIIIEPNKIFYNKKEVKENYKMLEKETNKKIEYITTQQLETGPNILLERLIKADFSNKGLEVITNPFYLDNFGKQIRIEEERLNNYINSIKPKVKKIEPEKIDESQKKHDVSPEKLSEFFIMKDKKSIIDTFKKEVDVGTGNLVILIGFEHGHYAKHLLHNYQIHNLINIEVLEDFERDETANDIANELAFKTKNRIKTFFFSKGEETFLEFFEFAKSKLSFIQGSKIIVNPLYEKKHMSEIKKYLKIVTKHLKSIAFIKGNSVSDEFYGMMNALYNLRKTDQMKVFKRNIQFDTVISVAGGPSLDDHMEYLKKIQDKYPVIAVEVIANKLVKNGIIPDIVCSQERTFNITKLVENFDNVVKKQSIFAVPNILHTYNFDEIDNFVIAAQTGKSPIEKYLYQHYYSFTHQMGQSIYVGEVNMNVAMWFKPKQVLLFGHDLAITPEKIYASESEGAEEYSISNSIKELGNRGQEVYITPFFEKFRNNTETILPKMIKEYGCRFLSFSDGAKINYTEDVKEEDFPEIFNKKQKKPNLLSLIQKANSDKEKIKGAIKTELENLDRQLTIFEKCENFSRFTIMATFIPLVLQNDTILNKVGRLLLDDFIGKYSYDRRGMEKWVFENKNDFISLIKRIKAVLEKTGELIDNPEIFPDKNSDFKTLFDYNLFGSITDKVYDIKEGINISIDDKLKSDLSKEELKYATLAFLYSFEPINYLKMGEVVSAVGKYAHQDEQAQIIYQEGLERLISFYENLWKEFKEVKETFFYRYQLASVHYAAGHLSWVIEFLTEFSDLDTTEKIILADAYSDFGNFEKAFELYKELLNDSQNIRILINAFHCLIASEKVAEAKLFHLLFKNYAEENEQYRNNLDILNKQVEEILNWTTDNGLKDNEELIKEKGKTNQVYVIDFDLKTFEDIKDNDINLLMELFARENGLKIYQLERKVYQILDNTDSKIPDFSFFINSPSIKKL